MLLEADRLVVEGVEAVFSRVGAAAGCLLGSLASDEWVGWLCVRV